MPKLQEPYGLSRLRSDRIDHTDSQPSPPPATQGTVPDMGVETPAPVRTLRDIPGLGPIRVRALEKAGLSSLSLLGDASRERLRAVPGMSSIKADHILAFLDIARAEGRFLPIETQPMEIETETESESEMPNRADGTSVAEICADWSRESASLRADMIALLTCSAAPDYRTRLLREMVRFVSGMPTWQNGMVGSGIAGNSIVSNSTVSNNTVSNSTVSNNTVGSNQHNQNEDKKNEDKKHETGKEIGKGDKENRENRLRERALRRVRRLQSLITELLPLQDLDRKMQARLADELAEASDRLYALSGQVEPSRKAYDGKDDPKDDR